MTNPNIPYYYEVHCINKKLKLDDCRYYGTKDCKRSCYLFTEDYKDYVSLKIIKNQGLIKIVEKEVKNE